MPPIFVQIGFWLVLFSAPPAHAKQEIVTAQAAVQPVTLTGFTRPRTVIDLSAEEAGKVMRVLADIGARIAENGTFACLDQTFGTDSVGHGVEDLHHLSDTTGCVDRTTLLL